MRALTRYLLVIGRWGGGSEEVSESDWEGIGETGQNQRHKKKKTATPEFEF